MIFKTNNPLYATFYTVMISRVEKGRRIGMAIGQMDLLV